MSRIHPPETRALAKRLYKQGWPPSAIAQRIGCNTRTVRTWLFPEVRERINAHGRVYKKNRKGVCVDCGGPTSWTAKEPQKRCKTCSAAFQSSQRMWTREKIIVAIQRWHAEYGRPPRSTEWRKAGRYWPSFSQVYEKNAPFDSWREAIQAAGYDTPAHTHSASGPGNHLWDRKKAVKLREAGISDHEIARRFGVSASAIYLGLGPRGDRYPVGLKPVPRKRTREQRIADLRKALARDEGEQHDTEVPGG